MDGTEVEYQVVHRLRAVDYVRQGVESDFPNQTLRGNRTPAGFVMLFTDGYHPIEPANLFLLDRCCTPARNGKWGATQSAYADDLAQWWTYLKVNNLSWNTVAADDIEAYANALVGGVSAKTGRLFSSATVSRRVGTVEELYRWAHREGYVQEPLSRERTGRRGVALDRSMLPHLGGIKKRSKGANRPKVTNPDAHVDPLAAKDLRAVLEELGASPYRQDPNDTRPTRDRLIAELSVYTGMRVEEVVGLTSYQILDLRRHDDGDPWKPVPLRITVTKGSVPRTVALPCFLLQALISYVDAERTTVLRAARERRIANKPREAPSSALFLNGLRANRRDVGHAVSTHTVMTVFTAAVRACGMIRTVLGYEIDPLTGQPVRNAETGEEIRKEMQVAAHTFHDLRHTFAVQFYWSELKRGNPSPWKRLQARLGHKRLSTTQDIYLRHVDVDEPGLSDDFARLLRTQLDEGA